MKRLNAETVKELSVPGYRLGDAPERILQFGEGNFLRAFVDYFVDVANEKENWNSKVIVVQPIAQGGLEPFFREQDNLYTLYLRGYEEGRTVDEKRIISAVSRYINPYTDHEAFLETARNPALRYVVSNTTEAGIVYDDRCRYEDAPCGSFPGKLTRLLHERWKCFGRDARDEGEAAQKGLVILSCELIDNNGQELKRCVDRHVADWQLEPDFVRWLEAHCLFCSTLVDRIVTGYPRGEAEALNRANGYEDKLLDTGECFGLWVIEGPDWLRAELPFERAGLPVKVVADHSPYKKQKVRILNGAHTSAVCAAYLSGQEIVRDSMADPEILAFVRRVMMDEVIPVVDLPKAELRQFAESVLDRFRNPFIDHAWLSIALNTTSKWRARVLPSLKDSVALTGELPGCLSFSLAAYLAFYRTARETDGGFVGSRKGAAYPLQDDDVVLAFFAAHGGEEIPVLVERVLSDTRFWGEDLTRIPGLTDRVTADLTAIERKGMKAAMGDAVKA